MRPAHRVDTPEVSFQSLIGTGKTEAYGEPVVKVEGFQSLIGTGKRPVSTRASTTNA